MMMKNKKKNIFIIILLIIVVLPILLSFIKCDNGNSEMNPSTTIQEEEISSKRLNKARAITGTAVPNTGYVESLYFNTNMSIEMVVSLLDTLTTFDEEGITLLLHGENGSVEVYKNEMVGYYIRILLNTDEIPLFISKSGMLEFTGWNPSYSNPIFYNGEVVAIDDFGYSVGTENDNLSSFFSITPFVETENKTGLQIIFEEIGSGLSGLAAFFVGLFNSIVPVFWVNGQPTIITILVLAGVVLTIGFWGIDKLLKLFKIGLGGKK